MLKRAAAVLRHVAVRHAFASLRDAARPDRLLGLAFVFFQKTLPIDERTILVESHKGASLIGSPRYMVRLMASSPRYRRFRIVVVARDRSDIAALLRAGGASIRTCRPDSLAYCYTLASAGLLINDTTFPPFFSRRPSQRYLNTWHGTPLKALGRRAPHGMLDFVSNTQRNFLHATHLLAPNRHTEDVLLRDYMIGKIAHLTVLRGGYPRNDPLLSASRGLPSGNDGTCHVAYMPTWRGTLATSREENAKLLAEVAEQLRALDGALPAGFRIWTKLHPMVKGGLDFTALEKVRPFPDGMETYEFLAGCDALVTDYSSVLFDFAATRRPVFLFMPDLTEYRSGRDFCIDPLSLPFPRAQTVAELAALLRRLVAGVPEPADLGAFLAEYCPHDDGLAAERLCKHFVLGEQVMEERPVAPAAGRKNVLLFVGSFLNNGITTSIKSLVSCIDLERYNLFLCVDARQGGIRGAAFFRGLDPRVGIVPTRNWLAADPLDGLRYLSRQVFRRRFSASDGFLFSLWRREFRRMFGSASFDVLVHFTGYDRRICLLMLGSDARRVVFMHSDMYDEIRTGRVADPRALRLSYDVADAIATVRENLDEQFSARIQDVSAKSRYVPNTLSTACIGKSSAPLVESLHGDFRAGHGPVLEQAMRREPAFRFVNLARFSPEKGHARLIRAFERVFARHRHAQLFILGPHGNLYENTVAQARRSCAAEAIFVSQGSTNPFPLLARADAFVFSSHYEGIGLVLYESFALGVPVIAPAIAGPAELLSRGYGLVVENSEEGLENGMLQAIEGELPHRSYDFEAHNRDALERLYEILG